MSINTNHYDNSHNIGQQGRCCPPRKTLDGASFYWKNKEKYCWTHGACGHTSSQCKAKAQRYQENATLKNRLGGSNA